MEHSYVIREHSVENNRLWQTGELMWQEKGQLFPKKKGNPFFWPKNWHTHLKQAQTHTKS